MEHFSFFSYNGGHETPWHPSRVGKAAPTRHSIIEKGKSEPIGHCPVARSIQELGLPVVPSLSRERLQGTEIQDGSRASDEVAARAKRETTPVVTGRAISLRISDRPVDLAAGSVHNSEELWGPIPPQSCLAIALGDGVELPETRTPGFGEKGRGNRPLEAVSLAAYKKTPKDMGPIWSFLMNPVSCSFQTLPGLGRPKGKHHCSIIFTNRIASRPSAPCRFPRRENGWPFIFGFGVEISMGWMCAVF